MFLYIITASVIQLPIKCDFDEENVCDFDQSTDDDFDWTIGREDTPTSKTGPQQADSGDFYAYIESSGKNIGENAQ